MDGSERGLEDLKITLTGVEAWLIGQVDVEGLQITLVEGDGRKIRQTAD